MSSTHSATDVARWMLEQLKEQRYLHQDVVVYGVADQFGDEFTYLNENGNLAIDRRVLREFRKLTEDDVVWERGERCWRFREDYDEPGRRAD